MRFPLFPPEGSNVARQTDYLFWALVAVSALVMLIVFVPMVFFLFKYRRGKEANRRPLERLPELRIEMAWTLIPLLIMIGFFVWGADHYFTIQRAPPDAMELNIVGKQWMWKIQHPSGNREINELHVPVGRNIKLTMTSQDVIHSFFLPEFRIKQDVLPGRYTTEWFKARKPGVYRLFCSEYCGTAHSRMTGRVIALEPARFEEWLIAGQPGATLAQRGEQLYRELGCSGCHSGISVVRAPPLEGLFGKPAPLESGEVVLADEAYLRDSIIFPNKQITAGYKAQMPSFQGRLNEEEIMQLIAYIKNQAQGAPGGNR